MPGFQSTRLATEGALKPFFFLYTDDSIQGNPETCKQSSVTLNYEVKNIQRYEEAFGDQAHILYVNASIQEDTRLGRLMHDLQCREADQMYSKILAEQVSPL